ncbi:MAG: DUF393 domain-containing protein [Acidipila sp.]|nr:DUF393 domain-containing protein [Acidipila sp.]
MPQHPPGTEWIFYDGQCGLCHRLVRFVLAQESTPVTFRFAPVQGELFRACIAPGQRQSSGERAIGDSIVVRTADDEMLVRSAAVIHILQSMGGLWRLVAGMLALIPAFLRDAAYDAVARNRHRWFVRPVDSCPVLPEKLRARFDT